MGWGHPQINKYMGKCWTSIESKGIEIYASSSFFSHEINVFFFSILFSVGKGRLKKALSSIAGKVEMGITFYQCVSRAISMFKSFYPVISFLKTYT